MVIKYAQKEKASAKSKVEVGFSTEVKEKVDRIAELTAKLAKAEPLEKELAKLTKELRDLTTDVPAAQEVRFIGTKFDVVFGECGHTRKISDMKMVRKVMGNDAFMEVATVTLKDIDRYVAKKDQESFIVEAQNGPRHFNLTPKE
jgi:hypothetical protein